MLWYKAWLDTRWRFLIGLVLLAGSAAATVGAYPEVVKLLPMVPSADLGGEIGRRVREAAELARDYRGYTWSQWYRQNLVQLWTLFAVILGSGGLVCQARGGGALFTLSLPVSRGRIIGVQAAIALGELLALAVIPSLLIPLLSPGIGQSYGIGDTIVHGVCLFAGGAVFFCLAFALSTVFADVWRPLLIALCVAVALAGLEQFARGLLPSGVFAVMSAEAYFRSGEPPWLGLLASAATSAALLYGAAVNIARKDF